MEIYLLKSAGCLAIFFIFYKALLENTSLHTFKRFYLLGGIALSFIIPLITFINYIEIPAISLNANLTNVPFEASVIASEENFNFTPYILWSLYGIGVFIFAIRFTINLNRIFQKIRKNQKLNQQSFYHVLLSEMVVPHTFFNHIFFNKTNYTEGTIPKEVFWHEETHAVQKHSADILLMELLQIAFWFNPLLYFFKRSMKLNHEFLADSSVLKHKIVPGDYQKIILAFSSNATSPSLAHSINYSSFKKRFTVMKNQTSKRSKWLRGLLVLPLLSVLLFSFSSSETVTTIQNESSESLSDHNPSEASQPLQHNGLAIEHLKATAKQIAAYNKMALHWNTYFEENPDDRNMPLTELKKLESIYRVMTPMQKKDAQPFPECIPKQQQDYTQQYLNGAARNDKKAFVLMITLNEIVLNGKSSSLKTLTADLDKLTKNWEETDYTAAYPSILIASSSQDFIKKVDKEFKKSHYAKANEGLGLFTSVNNNSDQNIKATPEQIAEYNKLAKKYNTQDPDNRFIRKSEVERMAYLYGLMTHEQRADAEPFPELPPPPPPAPNAPDAPKTLPHITPGNQDEPLYFYKDFVITPEKAEKLLKKNKELKIYPKTLKDGRPAWVLSKSSSANDIQVPPPPPPPAPIYSIETLDHVVRMAKENAAFLYEGKRISSDEAIELVKENPDLNVQIETFKNSNPIVNLSTKPIQLKK